MVSTIHDAKIVNTGRKDRKTNVDIKKPYDVVQYNKFMKGVDRADQYLSYYSVLRKTVKWSKKVLYLLNCALFNAFFVYRTLNTNKKVKYKNFLLEVGRNWVSEAHNRSEPSSDDLQLPEKQTTPRGPNQQRQADSPVISEYTNLKRLLVVWRKKSSTQQDGVNYVLHIRSEVKLGIFVNSVLFRFTKGLVSRNTIH
jgi:hypothetical protein